MEATKMKPEVSEADEAPQPLAKTEIPESVLKFSTPFKDRMPAQTGDRGAPQKRDFSSALDLVEEAFEAIRIAEDRAVAAEDYHQQLVQHHKEQLRALEVRLSASEKRAEAAEARAKEAETWLVKFHDTIVDGFQRTFVSK